MYVENERERSMRVAVGACTCPCSLASGMAFSPATVLLSQPGPVSWPVSAKVHDLPLKTLPRADRCGELGLVELPH